MAIDFGGLDRPRSDLDSNQEAVVGIDDASFTRTCAWNPSTTQLAPGFRASDVPLWDGARGLVVLFLQHGPMVRSIWTKHDIDGGGKRLQYAKRIPRFERSIALSVGDASGSSVLERGRSSHPALVMDLFVVLQRCKPFAHAPEASVRDLARVATTKELRRHETLWNAGEMPAAFCTIHSGLFKIVRTLSNGREAIMGLFGPRESIGDVAVIQGIGYPATPVVCSDTARVIQIPRAELLAQMKQYPGLAISINQSMGDRVQQHAQSRDPERRA